MGGGKDILFEKFEIIECLKKDNSACVYIAFHIYLGKRILLKTLDRSKISDPAMLKRFQREAKTLARLDHENIITVYDFGTFESFFYISFEYFKSRNLRAVNDENNLNLEQKKHIFAQIVRGVAFAHQHKIIHRDLKPENILVDDRLRLKIADFGLALIEDEESLTVQTSIVGTPGYMSPEQIRGEKLTPQSDLFSLGVVGYELFTGVNPFLGRDAGATLHNILAAKSPLEHLGDIPQPEAEIIAGMLQKSKNERMRSINQALSMLGISTASEADAAAIIPVLQKKRRFRVFALAGIAAIVMAVYLIVMRFVSMPNGSGPEMTTDADSIDVALEQPSSGEPQAVAKRDSALEIIKQPGSLSPAEMSSIQHLPGRLLIQCLPWAYVFVDSIKVDTTPMEEPAELEAGEYELRLEHPNFPAYVKKIRINAGKELKIAVDLDTLFGYFACNVYPWGDIVIDDVYRGQTPFAGALAVEPGWHALVVKNQQYESAVDSFFVARRDTFYYQLNFELADERQSLNE